MARLVKNRFPAWRRALFQLSRPQRRALREFATYPDLAYRVIVDVGAARGDFSSHAARLFNLDRVILVEARPDAAQALRTRFSSDKRFQISPVAISDVNGRTVFHVNEEVDSSSLLPVDSALMEKTFGRSFGTSKAIDVETLTLDTLYDRENLTAVDLLKVDIQGAEQRLIAGGTTALARTRAVVMEVNFERFYESAPLFSEIDALMRARGFRLHSLQEARLDATGNWLAYGNALYTRGT